MVLRIRFINLGKQIVHCKSADLFVRQQRTIHTTTQRCGLIRRYFRGILSYTWDRRMSPPWKHCTQIGEL